MTIFVLLTLMPTIEKTIGNERARFYVGIRSLKSGVRYSRFKHDIYSVIGVLSRATRATCDGTIYEIRIYIADLHTWSYSLPLRLCMSKWHSTLDAENDRNSRELSNCAISVFSCSFTNDWRSIRHASQALWDYIDERRRRTLVQ